MCITILVSAFSCLLCFLVLHSNTQGMKTVEVCSVGIDAFVVFIGAFYELVKTQSSADIILVAFGTEQLQIF